MTKAELTKDQASAIELLLKEHKGDKDELIDIHCDEDYEWLDGYSCIEELKPSQFTRALHVGYTIKPALKEGDYVKFIDSLGLKRIGTINEILFDEYLILYLSDEPESIYKSIVLAKHLLTEPTPEEIKNEEELRRFANHERGFWELRANDVLINNTNKRNIFSIVSVNKESDEYYDSTHTFSSLDYLKKNYTVLCFAEQRLDMKSDG